MKRSEDWIVVVNRLGLVAIMKVLIGVHHFPPVCGGAEWRAHRLASALQEAGHEASVICVERIDDAQAAPLVRGQVFEGVAVRRLSLLTWVRRPIRCTGIR